MNHIQASLSTMDLTNPPDYGLNHDSAVENLRKDLEAKEIFAHKYYKRRFIQKVCNCDESS